MSKLSKSLLIISILAVICQPSFAGEWKKLFNGENLDGWERKNGKAKYYAEDGVLVGQTVAGQPNSFLCTTDTYSDFILEYEMKLGGAINSGVQIRSESKPEYGNGRVHGYQVECDPSDRAWSGGIYDEARRGWLYPLYRGHEGRAAFNPTGWNKFRVEAVGPHIKTFVNGVPCADLVDDMTAEGFIGLQVHSVPKRHDGMKITWRNIRIMTDDLEDELSEDYMAIHQVNLVPNYLSEREKAEGWKLLWDGKTTDGWRGAKLDDFPEKGWKIEDGVLTVMPSGGAESAYGGDIVTRKKYGDFELKVDFKFTKGANSGIKYFVDPKLNKGPGSAIGCEFQILDDRNHPDAKKGVNGNRTLASLYDLIPAWNPWGKREKRNGWNQARILADGKHVEHWMNNLMMLEYERSTQMWRALVDYSKYKDWPDFGEAEKGNILLQDHGNLVHFRSIKIRELK
ncbi:hypothetical protein STSP2_00557 [Anaerohalosphaera lusitana]|uniref:3-keto-alpha-glucoside-1,2-lyase/3-keto-2-hydroxy-glucal hydratase domain-containing protein n=1 Tax=Anaerohalosphaera lusitana TaxID=1936003 RepID=A0A1U9NHM1_9BACT|nr:DUF1080 domain-containing protein [Anaerohalosphaera lusitana]AQT67413.1 hypothetical protein STSP2_00557 [Anaerohalosphaera lusitana]